MVLFALYVPTSFDIITYKNKNNLNKKELTIILYNKIFSITFVNTEKIIKVDIESYSIMFYRKFQSKLDEDVLQFNQINKFLKTFEIYYFVKIKFKGKGFKIKFNKKIKLIKFYFGRSHITYYKLKRLKLKKVTKYKFVIKSLNLSKLKLYASRITYVKPVNIYTLRGIRISRQFISKRKGKKSSYI